MAVGSRTRTKGRKVPAEFDVAGAVLLGALSDPVGLFERSDGGSVTLASGNRALARMLEQEYDALPGMTAHELLCSDTDARVLGHLHRAFDEQAEVGYEVVRERPHARYVHLGTVTPVSPDQVVLIERDVSEEHRLERRLEELESLTATGTWAWNLDDDELMWSSELRRIVGVGAGYHAHGDVAYDMVHPDDRGRVHRALSEVRETGVAEEFDYRVIRPSGEIRAVYGHASRAVDTDGRAVRLFGTIQDVTERRALEAGEVARQRMLRQQDRAVRLNDDVIQSLARAWLANDLDRPEDVRDAVTEGMETVRRMMADLLHSAGSLHGGSGRGLRPGELAHLRAARWEDADHVGHGRMDDEPRS